MTSNPARRFLFFVGAPLLSALLSQVLVASGFSKRYAPMLAIERHRCRHELARDFCGSNDAPSTREVEAAARSMGQQIRVLNVSTDTEIETAFATLTESRANALAVVGNLLVPAPHRVA